MQNSSGQDLTPPPEGFRIRCPRLGHLLEFSYCRHENEGLPCFKTLDCWHLHFPVENYLRQELSNEDWERAFIRARTGKLSSLLEMIQAASERTNTSK